MHNFFFMNCLNEINDTSGTCHVIFIEREQLCSVPKVLSHAHVYWMCLQCIDLMKELTIIT